VTRTLIAVDAGPTTSTTVEVGRALADALRTDADVVHVAEPGTPPLEVTVRPGDGPYRILEGEPLTRLLAESAAPDVAAVVVGAGVGGSDPPVGHVAWTLLERAAAPVLVVPAVLRRSVGSPPRHVLVPLETTAATGEVRSLVDRLVARGSEVTVAHVFDADHPPVYVDHPEHGMEPWGREFLARHGRQGVRLLLRHGVPWQEVLACADEGRAELLLLAWSQTLASGRATVVREALGRAGIPVLLVPVRSPGVWSG
jgi:hypothetical protein